MTNKTILKSGLLIAALLVGVLIHPAGTFAQSEKLQDALEDVNQSVEKVEKVEKEERADPETASEKADPQAVAKSSDANKEVEEDISPEELAAKTEALKSVLDFSVLEVEEIAEKLTQVKEQSKDIKTRSIATQMLDLLNYRAAVLADLLNTLEGDLTIEEVREAAISLKDWRETFYNPEIKIFLDAVLVHQAEIVVQKVDARLKKITQAVKRIEARVAGEPLTPLLQEAVQDFEKAQWYYSQAQDQVLDLFSRRAGILDFNQPKDQSEDEEEEEIDDTKIKAADKSIESIEVKEDEKEEPAQEEALVEDSEATKEALAKDAERAMEDLVRNNQEIEKMHKAVQLYAEQVSNYIRQTYRSFLKMSTKAKAVLSS